MIAETLIKSSKKTPVNIRNDTTITLYEMSRWLCLIEAIGVIEKFASLKNKSLDNNSWIKPIAFQKYIEERSMSMISEMDMLHFDKTIES